MDGKKKNLNLHRVACTVHVNAEIVSTENKIVKLQKGDYVFPTSILQTRTNLNIEHLGKIIKLAFNKNF